MSPSRAWNRLSIIFLSFTPQFQSIRNYVSSTLKTHPEFSIFSIFLWLTLCSITICLDYCSLLPSIYPYPSTVYLQLIRLLFQKKFFFNLSLRSLQELYISMNKFQRLQSSLQSPTGSTPSHLYYLFALIFYYSSLHTFCPNHPGFHDPIA